MRTLSLIAVIWLAGFAPAFAEDCRVQPAPAPSGEARLARAIAPDGLRVALDKELDSDVACVWSADGVDPIGVRTVAVSPCPGGITHCARLDLQGAALPVISTCAWAARPLCTSRWPLGGPTSRRSGCTWR